MRLLQSQVHLSRASMTGLAQQTDGIEYKIHNIFQVPPTHEEIADIHIAYQDCTRRTTSNVKCKPFRPPKTNKKMEPLNDNNAFEITYHDHVDLTFTADQLQPHNNSALSNEWPFHWSLQTQYYLAEYEVNVGDRRCLM